ncbi:uncharacterized protein DAT39_019722, partial [Clarias magur]
MGKKLISKPNVVEEDRDTSCSRVGHVTQEDDSSLASEKEEENNERVYQDCSESQSDSPSGSCHEKTKDEKVQDGVMVQPNGEMKWDGCMASPPSFQSSPVRSSLTKKDEDQSLIQKPEDIPCCILHLPFEKVLSSGIYEASITSPSLGSPLNYPYHPPQLAHERVSVLSPSLDELSSHDELLSTDLDDIDLFPSRMYARGRLAEVTSKRCHGSDLCLLYPKRLTCATCGSHTFKQLNRTKTCRYEDVEDSDEVEGQRRLRNTSGKGHSARKTHLLLKQKLRAAHHRETTESQHESSRSEHLCCESCTCSTEKNSRAASARLGYGMVLPPFPPSSYVEAPGYILPHTQLHMVDYRRMMAPHLAPAMSYQARRFRYQHTTPSGRVMVSSEVQTEPVCTESLQQACNVATSSSESGTTGPSSVFSSPRPSEDTSCVEKGCEVLPSKMAGETCKNATVQSGGILFQAEEVRIECSRSPSAVKIMRSKETTELASNADGKLLQCNVGCAEDVVLRCFQPLPFGDDEEREGAKDMSPLEDPCPDIVMVSCPSNGSVSTLEGSIVAPVEPVNSTLVAQGDPNLVKSAQDICGTSKDILFKILRLPVDLQCLDELQQMEASVWSVESLMPYIPTSEWMMQNSLLTPGKPSLGTVMEVPAEDPVQLNRSPAESTPPLLEAGTVTELDAQDLVTSLELLPSTHLLTNFSNAYCNELSSNLEKINDPNNWAKEQPEAHQSGEKPNAPPKKLKDEMDNQSIMISGSEQEKCAARLFPDSPRKHKVRVCKNCSVKHGSPSSKADSMKRHKVSHLKGDKVKALLCGTCKCDPEKKARYNAAAITANLKSSMIDELGEVSENYIHSLKKCSKKLCSSQTPNLGKHLEKCPMSQQSKLREQNCSCEERASNSTSAWNKNGHSQHGDLTWERNEENLAISAMDRWKDSEQRFGDEKWRGSMQVSDSESTKSGGKTKTRNKQKQSSQSL